MPDREEKITPGINLMLQSRDVSDTLLVEVFIREYYAVLFQMNWLLLHDTSHAESTALNALTEGISRRYTYWGETRLLVWLTGFAIKSARLSLPGIPNKQYKTRSLLKSLHELPVDIRIAFILHHGFCFTATEIGSVLSISPAYAKGYLDVAALSIPTSALDTCDDDIYGKVAEPQAVQPNSEIAHALLADLTEVTVSQERQSELIEIILGTAGKQRKHLRRISLWGKRVSIPR